MYIPNHFSEQASGQLQAFIQQFPLATIVCYDNNSLNEPELTAHHIPLLLQSENGKNYLIGHFAKANRVWEQADNAWLVIFSEGGAYISPNWYPSKAVTHKEVPTWNYRAVHIRGNMQLVEEMAEKLAILDKLTRHFEQDLANKQQSKPWQLSDAPSNYLQAMAKALVTFRFEITDIEGKFKLSQNKTPHNVAGVITGLQTLQSPQANDMANAMTNYIEKK